VPSCKDTRHLGPGVVSLERRGRSVRASISLAGTVLRTGCAGPPVATDSVGGTPDLATGNVPLAALGRRRLRIHLTGRVHRSTDGWAGHSAANVFVTLRRTGSRVTTLRF
jgi:hypothetical protein